MFKLGLGVLLFTWVWRAGIKRMSRTGVVKERE